MRNFGSKLDMKIIRLNAERIIQHFFTTTKFISMEVKTFTTGYLAICGI